MNNEARNVKYSNGKSVFDGVFHTWVKKKDEEGNELVFGLIEGVDGYLQEIKYDFFKFITEFD